MYNVESFDHRADLQYRVSSNSLEELFEGITFAVSYAIFVRTKDEYESLEGSDFELELEYENMNMLIHDYIEELIMIAHYNYSYFKLKSVVIDKNKLIVKLIVNKSKEEDYDVEVKACSYNVKYEKNSNGKYICEFILDI